MIKNTILPCVIFELANVHGGNKDQLFALIEEYAKFSYPNKAIKFQILKPDQIALKDFQWFPLYEELYFKPDIWQEAIYRASSSGAVWLDLFDLYGVEVFQANQSSVSGIKLQASVLDNVELSKALASLKPKSQKLMINVSGYDISQIEKHVLNFSALGFSNLILQLGFQSYPTTISNTALQKIAILKVAFPSLSLCMADHAPGETVVARHIPIWATIAGCNYVEKHFCIRRSDAKYDYQSALEPDEFSEMLQFLQDYSSASSGNFIPESEADYLKNSLQVPISKHQLSAGGLVGLGDLIFRRTNQSGFAISDIFREQARFRILSNSIDKNSTISAEHYRKAKIGVIVACRMKSSRLKKKAILPINGVSAIERCLQNCLEMKNVDEVVLATSELEEDGILQNYLMGGLVKFWQGNADDVIKRYLGACDKYDIDVIVRVTGDCPAVSSEITNILLKSHFETGADYTAANKSAVGSSPEIYNAEALRRLINLMGSAEHSEYMTWYMRNNADVFKVNIVDLPEDFQREYRLTLDYKEDLEMFEKLYATLAKKKMNPTISNIFLVLDQESSIPQINQHLTLSYKTDTELINMLNRVTRVPLFKKNT